MASSPVVDDASQHCSICLDPVVRNRSRAITELKCGHYFHSECIYRVFNTQNRVMRCPNCRDVERWLSFPMVPNVGHVPEGIGRGVENFVGNDMVPPVVNQGRARARADPLQLTLRPGTFTARTTADNNARQAGPLEEENLVGMVIVVLEVNPQGRDTATTVPLLPILGSL